MNDAIELEAHGRLRKVLFFNDVQNAFRAAFLPSSSTLDRAAYDMRRLFCQGVHCLLYVGGNDGGEDTGVYDP